MIQRDNGSPGITKKVSYRIINSNSLMAISEIKQLSENLYADKYILQEVHRLKGNATNEYLVTYKSKKEGLK